MKLCTRLGRIEGGNSITGTVTQTVKVTSGETLTITATGAVEPASKKIGVVIDAGGSVVNDGKITGGAGYGHGVNGTGDNNAGTGVVLHGGRLDNAGVINGGAGVNGTDQFGDGGIGAVGVVLDHGGLVNSGIITGGSGGDTNYDSGYSAGVGGIGADIENGSLVNSGTITGGSGGFSFGQFGYGQTGGIGVRVAEGVALNTGLIAGGRTGSGGYYSGDVNGAIGASVYHARLTNDGTITGAAGNASEYGAGNGGGGVLLYDGTVANAGTITGAAGGRGVFDPLAGAFYGGAGGIGVYMRGGSLGTSGVIEGGQGGGGYGLDGIAGAAGVEAFGGTISNSGKVTGGQGGVSTTPQFGGFPGQQSGAGGVGIDINGATLSNSGTITGGQGGASATQGFGGTGGVGVDLNGGVLRNTGTIAGGAPGDNSTIPGVGVLIGSGTLINAGTISGGAGPVGSGTFGDAVQFGTVASTLVVDPGAVFIGQVVANTSVKDVLDFAAGPHRGTLSGLGSQLTGFATIAVAKGADWLLTGNNTTPAGNMLKVAGLLTVAAGTGQSDAFDGVVQDTGAMVAGSGTLALDGAVAGTGELAADAHATLALAGGGSFAGALTGPGTIDIAAAFKLAEGASLSAAKVILQASLALGDNLRLANGSGHEFSLDAASNATLTVDGAAGDGFDNAGLLVATGAGTADFALNLANAGQVVVSAGTLAFLGSVTNTGTIDAAGGIVSFSGAVGGAGVLDIGKTGTVWLQAGAASAQSVDFLAGTGLLELTHPNSFTGTIDGFAATDRIDLLNIAATSYSFAGGVLTVKANGSTMARLDFQGSYSKADFALGSDGHGGTNITFV